MTNKQRDEYYEYHESKEDLRMGEDHAECGNKYCPDCEQWVYPIHERSYENSDADGNRGVTMDFYTCPVCGEDVEDDDDGC